VDPFVNVEWYSQPAVNPPRVPGLPEREEVGEWIGNVEVIAAETERFDQGDMIRLKEFAKGTRTLVLGAAIYL
jgi:hypothetical protein